MWPPGPPLSQAPLTRGLPDWRLNWPQARLYCALGVSGGLAWLCRPPGSRFLPSLLAIPTPIPGWVLGTLILSANRWLSGFSITWKRTGTTISARRPGAVGQGQGTGPCPGGSIAGSDERLMGPVGVPGRC